MKLVFSRIKNKQKYEQKIYRVVVLVTAAFTPTFKNLQVNQKVISFHSDI